MKIALVHDYLNQWGGAELVLETLAEMFPEAPIYTLLYDEERTYGRFRGRVRRTSLIDIPYVRRRHRAFIPLMPLAAGLLRVDPEFDLIISSSAGYGKGVSYSPGTRHISYCHTPLRYAWEQKEYLEGLLPKIALGFSKPVLNALRTWDFQAGQKPDSLLANSGFIAEKIRNCYGRDARVVYPPVDLSAFFPEKGRSRDYFIAVGRFLHYKRFDLVIEAWNTLDLPLKIVGNGPEKEKLVQSAKNPRITFMPFEKNRAKLRELYSGARALVFPQVEDFGLVAAEAVACGTPVLAYDAGGAKEIVTPACGRLFGEQTPEALIEALYAFLAEEKRFTTASVAKEARRFSKDAFRTNILSVVRKYFPEA